MTIIKAEIVLFLFLYAGIDIYAQSPAQQIQPVGYAQVAISDKFWKPKIERLAKVTIPVCIDQTEVKTPRIRNFEKVAAKKGEKHEGIYYDDSDVYKALEAIAYSLKNNPDATLEKKADEWVDKIAAAQEPDGYLDTYYSLGDLSKRWTDMEKHEDYCAGHLIEAAVAYYNSTGKRKLLDVAIRFADHIDSTFRQQNRHWVSGHQEIELALVKLYKTTGNKKYLDLSDWYLQQRGHGYGKGVIWDQWHNPEYCQDGVPVKDQKEITGHAVRAMYLYSGTADVAAAKNDPGYMQSMETIWQDVVFRNMYITGGIGSSGHNEGFSTDFDLPNEEAYCETCASVGMVFWNHRMNMLMGDSKYIDVLERSLYNGALDGLSMSGDRFFYANPLASSGDDERSAWFGTACCPANISRLIASLGDYIYGRSDNAAWINLFVSSETTIPAGKGQLLLQQESNYPWEGDIVLHVSPTKPLQYAVKIRIPGWVRNAPVPGDTYWYDQPSGDSVRLLVNGKPVAYKVEHGYASIERKWKKGDVVNLRLPMDVKKIIAKKEVTEDVNKVALERGPLVYCIEHADNGGKVRNLILPDDSKPEAKFNPELLGGIVTLQCEASVIKPSTDGSSIEIAKQNIMAIPYFTWANRGKGEMQVWIPRTFREITVN